ncbi:MAG: type I-C CRISPR-associated protein Cas5, partial [Xanthomonadales bacterium]|nr:type I-C CRISPR-associated protein Cas5 [Xanthomonadales bacterium]
FNRRARKGQCFHAPCLGNREFPANFALLEPDQPLPEPHPATELDQDLGWMLHDIDFAAGMSPRFFRARLSQGAIEVPAWEAPETAA